LIWGDFQDLNNIRLFALEALELSRGERGILRRLAKALKVTVAELVK
jgi:hypothetical protein